MYSLKTHSNGRILMATGLVITMPLALVEMVVQIRGGLRPWTGAAVPIQMETSGLMQMQIGPYVFSEKGSVMRGLQTHTSGVTPMGILLVISTFSKRIP
jgi:hypothetical protein